MAERLRLLTEHDAQVGEQIAEFYTFLGFP
jgi:hypothetical protein